MKTRIPTAAVLGTLAMTAWLAATACLAAPAQAQPMPPHGGPMAALARHGHGGHLRFLDAAERLDLTDAQRDQLRRIRRKAPGEIMPKLQAVMEARMDLQDLLTQDKTDKAALRRAHQKVLDAQAAVQTSMFGLRMDVRDVLTPEQRDELRKSTRGRGMRLRGPRGGLEPDWEPDDDSDF